MTTHITKVFIKKHSYCCSVGARMAVAVGMELLVLSLHIMACLHTAILIHGFCGFFYDRYYIPIVENDLLY